MPDSATITAAFDRAGYRLTDSRRMVAELIAGRRGHFTSADLVADARSRRVPVGRATIFRALEVLASLRTIERIDLPSGEHAYVACEPLHHHHVVCSRCGRVTEIADEGLRTLVRDIARRSGYRVDDHRLELFGVCPTCLAGEPAAAPARSA
ncbi:MAG TPA: Fur family transcriptional regulator [Clostridia bacterium]|nr:Fur family transcriptional regulator [Clostridia bacterium]